MPPPQLQTKWQAAMTLLLLHVLQRHRQLFPLRMHLWMRLGAQLTPPRRDYWSSCAAAAHRQRESLLLVLARVACAPRPTRPACSRWAAVGPGAQAWAATRRHSRRSHRSLAREVRPLVLVPVPVPAQLLRRPPVQVQAAAQAAAVAQAAPQRAPPSCPASRARRGTSCPRTTSAAGAPSRQSTLMRRLQRQRARPRRLRASLRQPRRRQRRLRLQLQRKRPRRPSRRRRRQLLQLQRRRLRCLRATLPSVVPWAGPTPLRPTPSQLRGLAEAQGLPRRHLALLQAQAGPLHRRLGRQRVQADLRHRHSVRHQHQALEEQPRHRMGPHRWHLLQFNHRLHRTELLHRRLQVQRHRHSRVCQGRPPPRHRRWPPVRLGRHCLERQARLHLRLWLHRLKQRQRRQQCQHQLHYPRVRRSWPPSLPTHRCCPMRSGRWWRRLAAEAHPPLMPRQPPTPVYLVLQPRVAPPVEVVMPPARV